jgi:GTP-binding protein
MNKRKSELKDMRPSGGGKTRLILICPSRGLIGYHSTFLTETRGTGIMSRIFHSYAPYKGPIEERRNGVLISTESGVAVSYSLCSIEERGELFVDNGTKVYQGMIIGEHSKINDLEVNPVKSKQLTNMRAAGKDKSLKLKPTRIMLLEDIISYIQNDEKVEITPHSIRMRKAFLDPTERKKHAKSN